MDSRQGGSDGVSTDGILTPALPTGTRRNVCVRVCVAPHKESAQMDCRAAMDATMLLGGSSQAEIALFVCFEEKDDYADLGRKTSHSSALLHDASSVFKRHINQH